MKLTIWLVSFNYDFWLAVFGVALTNLILFEQYWAYNQLKEVLDYADSVGLALLLDIPIFPSVRGAESIFHPEWLEQRNGCLVNPEWRDPCNREVSFK